MTTRSSYKPFSSFSEYVDRGESILFYLLIEDDILNRQSRFDVNGLLLYTNRGLAESVQLSHPNTHLMCVDCLDIDSRRLATAGAASSLVDWQASALSTGACSYSGVLNRNKIREAVHGNLTEGKRAQAASSNRLKRVVYDTLSRSRAFRDLNKRIEIQGDTMSVKVGKQKFAFKIDRDQHGWVKDAVPLSGHGVKMKGVRKAVKESFKKAHFQQILDDASSGNKLRLVMLDYTKLDGGRRTRLVEAYSYRFNANTNRTYFFGWNVEEGGIRSYILDHIHGARITDIGFNPRYLVELGENYTQDGPSVIDPKLKQTVSDALVKRGHQRFELAGGRGKIVKRLGHSVDTKRK